MQMSNAIMTNAMMTNSNINDQQKFSQTNTQEPVIVTSSENDNTVNQNGTNPQNPMELAEQAQKNIFMLGQQQQDELNKKLADVNANTLKNSTISGSMNQIQGGNPQLSQMMFQQLSKNDMNSMPNMLQSMQSYPNFGVMPPGNNFNPMMRGMPPSMGAMGGVSGAPNIYGSYFNQNLPIPNEPETENMQNMMGGMGMPPGMQGMQGMNQGMFNPMQGMQGMGQMGTFFQKLNNI